MKPGVEELVPPIGDSPKYTGKSYVNVAPDEEDIGQLKITYTSTGHTKTGGTIPIELFLVGDLKFLFMHFGRGGHSTSSCLYCKMKKSEWMANMLNRSASTVVKQSGRFGIYSVRLC